MNLRSNFKIIIFLAILTFGGSATSSSDEHRNTDVAMAVHGKEVKTAKKLLNNMQDFLHQLIKASHKHSKTKKRTRKRTRTRTKGTINMIEFFQLLCEVFGDLKQHELESIADTLETELKIRRDINKNYKALIKIPIVKRSLEVTLQTIRDEPPVIWRNIAKKLNTYAETSTEVSDSDESDGVQKNNLTWVEKLVSSAKQFFRKYKESIPSEFKKIIDDLDDYLYNESKLLRHSKEDSSEQKSTQENESDAAFNNLVKIVENAMKIFDRNANLNKKNHEFIEESLHALWYGPNKFLATKTTSRYINRNGVKTTSKRLKQDRRLTQKYMTKTKSTTRRRQTTTTEQSPLLDEDETSSSEKLPTKNILRNQKNEDAAQLSNSSDDSEETRTTKIDSISDSKGAEENSAEDSWELDNATANKRKIPTTKSIIRTPKTSQTKVKKDKKYNTESENREPDDKSEDKEHKSSHESVEKTTTSTKTTLVSTSTQDITFKYPQKRENYEYEQDQTRDLKILNLKNASKLFNSKEEHKITKTDKSKETQQSDLESKEYSVIRERIKQLKEKVEKNDKSKLDIKPEANNESEESDTKEPEVENKDEEKHTSKETQDQSKEKQLETVNKNEPEIITTVSDDPNNKTSKKKYDDSHQGSSDTDIIEKENGNDHKRRVNNTGDIKISNFYDINHRRSKQIMTLNTAPKPLESTIKFENITASINNDTTLTPPECNDNKCNITSKTVTVTENNSNSDKNAEVLDWSTESENLYKTLEKESKNLPLKELLDNNEILYLKQLNITVVSDIESETSTYISVPKTAPS